MPCWRRLFGLPAEMGVAVSLLKRAREIVLGVPALIYWQSGREPPALCRWRGAAMSDIALVTGASGFVGSAVARALVARGLTVRVLMRPSAVARQYRRPGL